MIDRDTTWNVYTKSNSKQKYLFSSKESDNKLFSIAQKYDIDKDEETNKLFTITVGDIILGFYKIEDTVPLLQQELGLDPRTAALLGADVLDFLSPLSDPNWQPPVEEGAEYEEELEDQDVNEYAPVDNTDDYYSEENIASPLPVTNNQPNKVPPVTYDAVPATNPTEPPTSVSPVSNTSRPQPTPQNPTNNQSIPSNPALHTMASDMEIARQTPTLNLEDTPTYVAQNQDSLRQPLSQTPTYTPVPNLNNSKPTPDIEPPRWSSN